MGNIFKGHILQGSKNRKVSPYEKNSYTVAIIKQSGGIQGYAHGETLEKARIEARKKVDELIKDNL